MNLEISIAPMSLFILFEVLGLYPAKVTVSRLSGASVDGSN